MKNATRLLPALAVLLCVSLSCTFLKGLSGNSPYGVKVTDISPVTSIDPKAEFPALSTDSINALIIETPELAKHRDKILDLERAAINGLVADSRTQASAVDRNMPNYIPIGSETRSKRNGSINFIPVAYAADDAPSVPDMGGIEYFLVGYQGGFFTPDFEKSRAEDRGKSKTNETKDDNGSVLAAQTVTVNGDGTVSAEITTNINMPLLGLNANSRVKITGNQCPSSDGKIDLTIEVGTNGRAGSSGSVIYDKTLTGKVTATVNDDAELADFDFDMKQATRSTAGGRQVYVESSQAVRSANGTYSGMDWGDPRIDRASSQATAADAALSSKGLLHAFLLAQGILENAKGRWKDGGCVKIEATSPGSVDINSTNQIPVKVVSKVDGSDAPSKLESKLTGEASIEPALIPKTAGTLKYTAPGEKNKKATISLKATSRRGIAKLDLDANTGSMGYRVSGSSNNVSFSGEICSLSKQFTIDATYPGGTATTTFYPGGDDAGSTTVSGGGGSCKHTGGGDYTVILKDDGSGTLTWTTSDTIECPFTFSRTATFSLTLQPAPELSCP